MKTTAKTSLVAFMLLLAISCKKENSNLPSLPVTDNSFADDLSNIGPTAAIPSVMIGTQRWMTLNLNVSRYRNGDKIPQVTDPKAWWGLTTGAWCWYNNDSATYAAFGKLYNLYAVHDPRGLAPLGWHVATNAEWTTLVNYFQGAEIAGAFCKEAGTTHWAAPNTGATDSSGFTGLPGGYRKYKGTFHDIHQLGYWWTSSEETTYSGPFRFMSHNYAYIGMIYNTKKTGFSVRCIKD